MKKGVVGISDIFSQEVSLWKKKLEAIAPSDNIGKKLLEAISVFDDFKRGYTGFFLSNMDGIDLPVDWFLFNAERTLLEYWEPIKRAADHYLHYPDLITSGSAELEKYKSALKITRDIPAILYFDKVPRALRIPFGPIVFIGIPLTDAYRGEWKSIPHELGHHVYWNCQFTINDSDAIPYQQQIKRISATKQKEQVFENLVERSVDHSDWSLEQKNKARTTLSQWSEEIFAEVIGVQIGGAEFVDAAWEKALNYIGKPKDAFFDDGDHPKPYLLSFLRKCAGGEDVDISTYVAEVQQRIGSWRKLSAAETDLMKASKLLVQSLSPITATLKPIVTSELKPFDRLRELFPDNKSVVENLLRPFIQAGALTWTCGCGLANDINRNVCSSGLHNIPFGYKILRVIL